MILDNDKKIANYIVIPNDIKEELFSCLLDAKIDCTILNSSGMFLKAGQTTCLSVTNESQVDTINSILLKIEKEFLNKNDNGIKQYIIYFTVPVIDFKVF